jgi:hypothetical protein
MSDYISDYDLVFNKNNGITSGGFSVNSIMMREGISPIITLNSPNQHAGGNVSDLFNNLVVPNWAYTFETKLGGNSDYKSDEDTDSDDDVKDELYDKLLELARSETTTNGGSKRTTHEKNETKNEKNIKNFKNTTRKKHQIKQSKNKTKRLL